MKTEHYDETIITDLGNDLYQLSCEPWCYWMFEIHEVLAVGETVEPSRNIAFCSTEVITFYLRVPFYSKIVRINQALVDFAQQYQRQAFNKNAGFSQADWIVEVQKIDKTENENPFYYNFNPKPFEETWYRTTTNQLDIEVGFTIRGFCTNEMYFKNFQLLGTSFKRKEPICSFEYCPKYFWLAYQSQELLSQELEKYKKLAYLYAPYDISKVDLPFDMYEAVFSSNDWLLWHCKREPMLKIKRTFYAYTDANYCLWYQIEGENIRIGLYTKQYEYIENHGYLPCQFPLVGKVIAKDEFLFQFVVLGPYDPEVYASFDMEIISQNPKNEEYEINAGSVEREKYLGRNSFSEENFYEKTWLFVVRPLYPEKAKAYLDSLFAEEHFI